MTPEVIAAKNAIEWRDKRIAELEAAIKAAAPMLYGYEIGTVPAKAKAILMGALKEQSDV